MIRIILASASPRRKELLSQMRIPFEVRVSGCSEDCAITDPEELVKELSRRKAEAAAAELSGSASRDVPSGTDRLVVLGADTVVVSNGEILGKPADDEDAFRMIRGYCGRVHHVFTGVTLIDVSSGRRLSFSSGTAVYVSRMSDEEIRAYISTGEPADKAGAYAIQGFFAPYVERVEGEYSNVVGLPLAALRAGLAELLQEDS